jgi:hypothetical protein
LKLTGLFDGFWIVDLIAHSDGVWVISSLGYINL